MATYPATRVNPSPFTPHSPLSTAHSSFITAHRSLLTVHSGFSLVELLVVIAIVVLLLAFGMPAYSTWRERQAVETEIVKLYGDLQFARKRAYCEKALCGISWAAGSSRFSSYQVRSDGDGDYDIDDDAARIDPVVSSRADMKYAITSSSSAVHSVSFDGRGFARNLLTFYIQSNSGAAANCVVVSTSRTVIGSWDGNACTPR